MNLVNLKSLLIDQWINQDTLNELQILAQSSTNLLIAGSNKDLNTTLLRALFHEKRYNRLPAIILKEDTSIDFRSMYPEDEILPLNNFKSVLGARSFLEGIPEAQVVIADIKSPITSELYTLCCEGLRNDVLAGHTCAGDLNAIKQSIASLNQDENRNLPFNIVLERIQRMLEIIILCNETDGKISITIHRNIN
ncbi:hypothetical protein [Paenibacillus amylolyticus]|uniref:hypothetical protein n=1 Tax=Paenibacillus amylolyticus TaxID=1451 RepID=UPI003391CA99